MRWRIDLEYDGERFAGWQLQPGQQTIQGEVETALAGLLGHPTRISCAGRTDAGVHARQQVASFVTEVSRAPHQLVFGLNSKLPEEIACVAATPVDDAFDPRRSPHCKRYVYTWLDRPGRSPLRRGRVWLVRKRLDHEAMAAAAAVLVGTHDFSSFRAAGCQSTHPTRTMKHVGVERHGDEVRLAMHGTGFLRHMVRIVAGSLWEIGRGRRDVAWMQTLLHASDRGAAGDTAPPGGLCLEWVRYDSSNASGISASASPNSAGPPSSSSSSSSSSESSAAGSS